MYRIIDSRASGKTSRLMLLVKESDGILVCRDPEKARIKASNYGFTGMNIISYGEYLEKKYDKKCFIDDLEDFVKFLGNDLSGYTISKD